METISGWWAKGQTTIFPICAWWYSPRHNKMVHERLVVISNDRRHNNQWVQHAMEEAIKFFASRMEEDGVKLTHLHMWTDGCGGQFKNKWQLHWLTTLLESVHLFTKSGVQIVLEAIHHNFFGSNHGKGVCDGLGATVKTILKYAQMAGLTFNDPRAMYEHLLQLHEIDYGEEENRYPRFFMYIDKDGVKQTRPSLKRVVGMKSFHSFIGRRGGMVEMCELSCYCPTSFTSAEGPPDPTCRTLTGERPEPRLVPMTRITEAARDVRDAARAGIECAMEVLGEATPGDLLLVYVPPSDRREYPPMTPMFEKAWNCQGRYRLAQLVELPDLDDINNSRRPTRAAATKIKVFLSVEEVPEQEYGFPSGETCMNHEGRVVSYSDCPGEVVCEKKHYYEVEVGHVRMAIQRRNRVNTERGPPELLRAERYRLSEEEIEAMDDILEEFATAYSHHYPA